MKSDLSDTPTPIVFNTFTYKTLWSEIYSTISSNHVCSITVLSYNFVLKCLWIKVIHVFVLVIHFHPLKAFKGIGKAPLENLTDVQRMFYVIKCKTTCLFTSLLDFLKCWFWNLVPNKQWSHGLVIHVHGNLYKHVFYLYVEQLEIQFKNYLWVKENIPYQWHCIIYLTHLHLLFINCHIRCCDKYSENDNFII